MFGAEDLDLPASLAWLRELDDGRAWLGSLPTVLAEACSRWSLTLSEPYEGSYVSVVLPAEREGSSPLVLKVQYPHRESDHEARLRFGPGTGMAPFD